MDEIILLVMGLLISAMGIVNICGNVSTIHSYNRRKVAEEDIPKYGRAVGVGTLIIGASLVAAYVLTLLYRKVLRAKPLILILAGIMAVLATGVIWLTNW